MGASNFWRTNVPSGIIYAFAMQSSANEQFDLLLKDEAGEWMTEDDRDMQTEMMVKDDYRETIDFVKEKLGLSSYAKEEWLDRYRKIIGYVNVTLYNKDSKEWEDGSINVLVEHGYHDGARLDISIDDLEDNFPPLNKSQKKLILREILRIEKVFKEATRVQYRKVWSLSNGEGVYESVV